MVKVAVFRFTLTDRATGKAIEQPRMATQHAIREKLGQPLLHSERLVNESELDNDGFYPPSGAVEIQPE
jgi:hypothetical protein